MALPNINLPHSASEILNYCTQFKTDNNYNSTIFFNDSILHATMILKELFSKALTEEEKTINMYCGKFSLFRDETKEKIQEVKYKYYTTDGLPEEDIKKWVGFDPFTELQEELSVFLSENGKLNIIMEADPTSLQTYKVWTKIKNGIESNKVKLFHLYTPLGVEHYTVTRDAYRLENSDSYKTAVGCFQDPANAKILNDNFKYLMQFSQLVRLN